MKFYYILKKTLLILCIIIFIFSGFSTFNYLRNSIKNRELYDDIRASEPFKNASLDECYNHLKELNTDYEGWINITNSEVDYPIVKSTDNTYYLNHDFLKNDNIAGAIFIDCNSKPFIDRNTIIYGHYMKDGSMFGSFKELIRNKSFQDSRIYIALNNQIIEYEIFSVYSEEANIDSYQTFWINDSSYLEYLNKLKNKSRYSVADTILTPSDKILTLSTCSYDIDDGRLLIHAKRL